MGFFKVLFYLWGLAHLLWGLSRFYNSNERLDKVFELRDFLKSNGGVKKKLEEYPDDLAGYLTYHVVISISFMFWCILGALFTSINWFGFILGIGMFFVLNILGALVKGLNIAYVIYYTLYWSAYIGFVGFLIINAFHLNINIFNHIF